MRLKGTIRPNLSILSDGGVFVLVGGELPIFCGERGLGRDEYVCLLVFGLASCVRCVFCRTCLS